MCVHELCAVCKCIISMHTGSIRLMSQLHLLKLLILWSLRNKISNQKGELCIYLLCLLFISVDCVLLFRPPLVSQKSKEVGIRTYDTLDDHDHIYCLV